jgi:hypothetical protein
LNMGNIGFSLNPGLSNPSIQNILSISYK